MEWKDLRPEVKATLELCWGLRDDRPRSITREVGAAFTSVKTWLFSEESYQQILEWQKHDPVFEVVRAGNFVTCTGNGLFSAR